MGRFESNRLERRPMVRMLICAMAAFLAIDQPRAQEATRAEMLSRSAHALHDLLNAAEMFEKYIEERDLLRVHGYDAITGPAVNLLLQGKSLAPGGQEEDLAIAILTLSHILVSLHDAVHAMDQKRAEAENQRFAAALDEIQRFYPVEFRQAVRATPDKYTCPMHPEVNGSATQVCPRCGMTLQLAGPFTSMVSATPTMSVAGATWGPVLSPGQETQVRISLRKRDGSPLLLTDLLTVHTRKIHLLIIDESLTDYHHEHPEPSGVAGEYVFRLTPRKPGSYRVWIDLLPWESGRQEYVMIDLGSSRPGDPLADRVTRDSAVLDGLTYRLILDDPAVKAGKAARVHLRITSADGTPFTALEPVMGAFAHLVGFTEDRKTVLHSHPLALEPGGLGARGAPPVLDFYVYSTEPGFIRLFAQVQIEGAPKFASFGVTVVP